jgi:predicted DNA-binding transcriptional regulator YafY
MTTKRTERLFLLVNLLRSGRGYTAPELAELLGVSPRTIYRDVVDLSSVVSVYYDGGYRLLTEEYVANLSFTRDELLALRLAVQLPPLAQASHLVAAARSALAKVDEQLDRRFGGDAGFDRSFSVHVAAHPLNPRMVRILRTLEDAVRTRRRVTITYYTLSRDATMARAVDPYGLSFRRHSWYLVGYCLLRREVRVFRLDRISRVKLTEDRFDRPEGFGVEKFFADAWEV